MLSLPIDVLGVVLKNKRAAKSLAATCTRGRDITRSLFYIVRYVSPWDHQMRIVNNYKDWSIRVDKYYITPLYTASTRFDFPASWEDDILANTIQSWRQHLGVAEIPCANRRAVAYNLDDTAELEYFGQFVRLHGPITGVYTGEPRDFGPNTAKIGDITVFYS